MTFPKLGGGKKLRPKKAPCGKVITTFSAKQKDKEQVSETRDEFFLTNFHTQDEVPCRIAIANGITRGRNFGSVKFEVTVDIPCDRDNIDAAVDFATKKCDEVLAQNWDSLNEAYNAL